MFHFTRRRFLGASAFASLTKIHASLIGKVTHKLGADERLAMQWDASVTLRVRTRQTARYIVVLAS